MMRANNKIHNGFKVLFCFRYAAQYAMQDYSRALNIDGKRSRAVSKCLLGIFCHLLGIFCLDCV